MSVPLLLLCIACLLVILSLVLILLVKRVKNKSLIPPGKIVYDDLQGSSFSLYSKKYPLVGKPDLILKKGWKWVPVEVKTGNHHEPRPNHVMQLLSYCQLIKDHFRKSSSYGYILYPDTGKRFKIPFNRSGKKQLKQSIHQMREMLKTGIIKRNHTSKQKCDGCFFKSSCQSRVK